MDNTLNISIANPRKHIEYVQYVRPDNMSNKLILGLSSGKLVKVEMVNTKSEKEKKNAKGELDLIHTEVAKCLRKGIDIESHVLDTNYYEFIDISIDNR